nr:MAG TPA: hypothetical protein [Caudoviricetes sp.]
MTLLWYPDFSLNKQYQDRMPSPNESNFSSSISDKSGRIFLKVSIIFFF